MVQVLLFPVDSYDRYDELEDLTDNELIELANDDEEVCDYTLKEFQYACNNEEIDLNGWWVYFVNA